jgi:hypothetical protein
VPAAPECSRSPVLCFRRVVEQDIADILLDAWQARAAEGVDISQSSHAATAKEIIDAADQQEFATLEKSFMKIQEEHDEHSLGDVADRILIYSVQKGWGAACKVRVQRCSLAQLRAVLL